MSDEFEKQLELEAKEKEKQSGSDPYTYVDPNDGTVYEWDVQKKAWFPKLTEDFLAAYHANYGSGEVQNAEGTSQVATISQNQQSNAQQSGKKQDPKAKPSDPGWFEIDDAHNTRVYVSNLPSDMDEEEFVEIMAKCGLVMKDEKGDYKIKLYRTPEGNFKGDALCCYIKVESVDLALRILDGYRLRGQEMRVERARFQLKGGLRPHQEAQEEEGQGEGEAQEEDRK
ncbi:hypothetical protein HPB47_018840, partial [Ixodes persulcatus]